MNKDKSASARAILGLAATIGMQIGMKPHRGLRNIDDIAGEAQESIGRERERKDFHNRPNFHNLEKIPSDEAFITSGYDELTMRHYAAIMRRLAPENIPKDGNPWKVAAKCQYGFETPEEAKADASKQFPLLAVLSADGNEFSYPNYTHQVEMKSSIITKSDERRRRRAEKMMANAEKTKAGLAKSTLKRLPKDDPDNTFKCEHCGGVFEKEWSDEEAKAEHDKLFPGHSIETAALICDDCFIEFNKDLPRIIQEMEGQDV